LSISILNNSLVICIEDDGKGFKQAQIKQVLERGIRGDTYQDGHGVGLAIVRDLVESYQGTFDISYSQKLTGAKCTLHFSGY
jgi:two-component system sensor histidine kinase PhoQ